MPEYPKEKTLEESQGEDTERGSNNSPSGEKNKLTNLLSEVQT